MNSAPIKKFIMAIKISSGPSAELTLIPSGPVILNSSTIPISHSNIPTAYVAIKFLVN